MFDMAKLQRDKNEKNNLIGTDTEEAVKFEDLKVEKQTN